MEVLDTNVIIRYLTQDDPAQAARARTVFEEVAAGTRTLSLSEAVLVETIQVLSSKRLYNLSRADIHTHLTRLLKLPAIQTLHKRTCLRALDLYRTHPTLSFVDSYCVADAERQGDIAVLSFDQGFDHHSLPMDTAVRRLEP
ncbi:MAG: PIN domain-containing protein [Chloroflexi bacterium]|nr:PIN domain-containing protein [Chloroflexota bacterium]